MFMFTDTSTLSNSVLEEKKRFRACVLRIPSGPCVKALTSIFTGPHFSL
jgi:hypothetical protein